MADSPNYGYNRSPRFSFNHVAEYITAETAGQRESVIRAAKFPRKAQVVSYGSARRSIGEFLGTNTRDLSRLNADRDRLETRLRREPEGWMKGELRRNIEAIEALKATFPRTKKLQFVSGAVVAPMRLAGVLISARLDLGVTETSKDGVTYSGGCVLFIATTEAARKDLERRSKLVAAMIHWALQSAGGNTEPLERLCLSFDVFGGGLTKAPTAVDRLRTNVISSCGEAAARWPSVKPPAGYDGPDWE